MANPGMEVDNGGPGTAEVLGGESKGFHRGVPGEESVHRGAELADSFAMNDSQFENTALATELDVIRYQGLYIRRAKGVQIEHAVNRQFERRLVPAGR
jgi:hypothetical protein